MKLIAQNLEAADSILRVRWCLEPSDAARIKEVCKRSSRELHFFILFVIAYEGEGGEDRFLIPLDQILAFLPFRRPGTHTVFARLVWNNDIKELEKQFLRKVRHSTYDYNVLNEERTAFREDWDSFEGNHIASDELEVLVPKEHFAKEPPAWVVRWANFMFEVPPDNQCNLRKRLIWAFTGQPILTGLWAIITTIIRFCVAGYLFCCGFREVNYKAVIRPWQNEISDVVRRVDYHSKWREAKGSWFLYDSRGNPRSLAWRAFWMLFHPLYFVAVFAVLHALSSIFHLSYAQLLAIAWQSIVSSTLWVWSLILFVFSRAWWAAAVLAAVAALYYLIQAWSGWLARRQEAFKRTKAYRNKLEQETDFLFSILACQPSAPSLSVAALPKQRRTLYLRFQEFKTRVCLPFAR